MYRVLVVDDDRAIREIISETLSIEGYEIATACNGKNAIELVASFRPHLILMDLMMPVVDGVEATRSLKSSPVTSWIRIIAMSAGMNLRAMSRDLPADSLVSKPFDLDGLLADVSLHLRYVEEPQPVA